MIYPGKGILIKVTPMIKVTPVDGIYSMYHTHGALRYFRTKNLITNFEGKDRTKIIIHSFCGPVLIIIFSPCWYARNKAIFFGLIKNQANVWSVMVDWSTYNSLNNCMISTSTP